MAKTASGNAFAPSSKPIPTTFTIGQVAKALRCHERSARLYLREVNGNIDCYASNRAEPVDRQTLVALYSRYAGNQVARRLTPLLQS